MNKNKLEELNEWVSKLSLEEIKNLSEAEVLNLVIERPDHPGQYGFMLRLPYFKSEEHLALVMHALLERLQKVDNLKEKMDKST